MSYYNDTQNIEQYIQMAKGYDGLELINTLRTYLPAGATVLELGMGPGKDLALLNEHFVVTGSDMSPAFIERYQALDPDADLLLLDAATLNTERQFDCIYSNKVLHHLSRQALAESFSVQAKRLNDGGLLCHSFWYGEHEEEIMGMHIAHYTEEMLYKLVVTEFELIECQHYTEMDDDDSLYLICKKVKT
ncbi:MAG: class I SAM-dependent methyltransferase [Chloroflexota bacterium]